jgi:phosphatidylglycerophosphate synthase
METFRPRDLLTIPGFLTLVRAPLALAFPFVVHQRAAAIAVLAAAGASDILDGWSARRLGRTTMAGRIVDPVVDKVFVASVALTLLATGRLSLVATLLLGARDLVELPLVVWFMFDAQARAHHVDQLRANKFGKIVTALQFATVIAAVVTNRYVTFLAVLSGSCGVVAGISYLAQALGRSATDRHGGNPGSRWRRGAAVHGGRPS